MSRDDIKGRERLITEFVESQLPSFVQVCGPDTPDTLMFCQEAFAADYRAEEIVLLGCVIKYAGLHGKDILIGCSREKRRQK